MGQNHWRHVLVACFIFFFCQANGQDFAPYEQHYYQGAMTLPYRYLRPLQYDATKRYPLIIFLHGAGHKGSDNERQLLIGGAYFLRDSIRNNYPAYVLFPQCPPGDLWASFETSEEPVTHKVDVSFPFYKTPTTVSGTLMALLDSLQRIDAIDTSRIYMGGLSQGAMGVLDLIARYPERFAAAFAICGAGKAKTAEQFANKVSLWLFHGEKDDVIPVSFSRDYFKRLQKAGADVRFTEYKDTNHDSWTQAFREPTLLEWLFSKANRPAH